MNIVSGLFWMAPGRGVRAGIRCISWPLADALRNQTGSPAAFITLSALVLRALPARRR